jgi:hypothetical protein
LQLRHEVPEQAEEPLAPRLVHLRPGFCRKLVRRLLDRGAQGLPCGGERAAFVEHVARSQPLLGTAPLVLGPAAEPAHGGRVDALSVRMRGDHGLEAVEPVHGEGCDVTIETVFTEQRARVPQGQVRWAWHGQAGMTCVQRPAILAQVCRRLVRKIRRFGHDRGVNVGAPEAAQGGVDSVETGRQDALGARVAPGIGEGAVHHRRREVVEDGGHHVGADRSHGSRTGGEVAHPAAAQPRLRIPLARLGDEVDDGVDRLEMRPRASGRADHAPRIMRLPAAWLIP